MCYFYGMPKIHKEGVPLRPIVATCGSPNAVMAKWLANTLSPFLGKFSNSHLYHTQDFITRIRNLGYTPGRLVSFDVTALFTSIPLDDVLNFLETKHSEGQLPLPIPVNLFIRLVRLCAKSSIFLFDDKVYQQAYGVSMGSPLSPILANLYMEYFESTLLPQIPEHLRPSVWLRYVDDVFSIYPHSEESFQEFLRQLNGLAPTIRFTTEIEQNGVLPYLDVNVHKDNGRFRFSIYRKPTHSESYIHYFSCHPITVKRSVTMGLFLRAFRYCDPEFLDQEIDHLFRSFSRLGYPQQFLKKSLIKAKGTYYHGPKGGNNNTHIANIKLPFLPPLSHLQKTLRDRSINLVFKQTNTLR